MMRAWVILVSMLLPLQPLWAQRIVPVDRIVAVVNKDVITMSELGEQVDVAMRELKRRGTSAPDRDVLQRQVLERLIVQKAQLQMAKDIGIQVDELQLDRAIQRIAESNNLTLSEFRRTLERDNIDFDRFRREVRDQIVLNRVREREVDSKIQVSESEIDLYLEESRTAPTGHAEYNALHILVRVPEQASPEAIEQARAKADKVRAEAATGADFARLSASYSDAPNALEGGALGWRSDDRLPDLFANALAGMQMGTVSGVLRSPAGFHVLKLLERRGAGAVSGAPVEQTHARHILVRTNEAVSEADAQRRLRDLRERMVRGGVAFEELARLHSEDASAARGGDLGWLYPGDTVPDFERAMAALRPGEVSEPIKTPFGWHLIQVVERRRAEMSAERQRLQVRQILRERKADEAYDEWLRQVRDQAYVELRLEER